jgi:hypothetical protein
MRVIDTTFVYYLTWHLEKGRGTWFIPLWIMVVITAPAVQEHYEFSAVLHCDAL